MINDINHLINRFGVDFKEIYKSIKEKYPDNSYIQGHAARFAATATYLNQLIQPDFKILELGFSNVLHNYILEKPLTYDYTVFNGKDCGVTTVQGSIKMMAADYSSLSTALSINFELEKFPIATGHYDLIICCEVIEHLDIDPMFLMEEINRILVPGGILCITTPNSTSARIVYKVLNGYHPSFFMKYSRDRSPYRHNFEYTPQCLTDLCKSAGFKIDFLETIDAFEEPLMPGYELLNSMQFNAKNRGDMIIVKAIKTGALVDRYPSSIYF